MGCTNYDPIDYESNQREDYLTKTIYESIIARKRAKIQDAFDAERKEQEEREKELMRQQYLLNSIDPHGPKSYIDNLINTEIPKMKFGVLASEEELINDLNDRDCEELGEGEKEEDDVDEKDIEEIKEEQEKNKNEMEELKKKLEELNKKSEEEKNGKYKSKNKKNRKDFLKNKKLNEDKDKIEDEKNDDKNEENEEENEINEEKENKNNEINEEEEEENESNIKQKTKNKSKNIKRTKKDIKSNINEENEDEDEGEGEEDDEEEGEISNKNNKNKKIKKFKNKKNKNNNEENEEDENEEKEDDIEKGTKQNNEENEESESIDNKAIKKGKQKETEKERKKRNLEKRKTKMQNKLKELMKLKKENPPYIDKIKKYKYPKKEIEAKVELDFSPTPSEIIICVIGDEKNGKTSFIKKYTRNVFDQTYKKTESIDTYNEIEAEFNSNKIKLSILDTPCLNNKKNISLIQEKGINKSHIIFYIVDINDEYADFKVKLTMQNFEFNQKQIIVIIGNKSDKASIFSQKNKDSFEIFCSVRKYFFKAISCQDTPQNEIENYINDNIIKEYFKRYK